MKIGIRLTLWGAVITSVACATVCILLYAGLSASLHDEVDRFLEGEVQEFTTMLIREDDESDDEIETEIRRELGSRARNDLTFRLLGMKGDIVLSSRGRDDPISKPIFDPRELADGGARFDTTTVGPDRQVTRVRSMRIKLDGRGDFIAQATYSLSNVNDALRSFRNLALGVFALAVLGAIVGGRIIAAKSLRPIDAMTRTIQSIRANDLSKRLACTPDGDELDELAGVVNEMLNRLERQVVRIRQFTADAAHELRTPLTALRGNAEVALNDSATPEARRQTLEESIEEYDRLSRLTDDLLLLARADAGDQLVQRTAVRLDNAIDDVVELFHAVADEKDISIRFERTSEVVAYADSARIRQVLCNLFDNAIKFTPTGGNVSVDLATSESFAIVTISDTGTGIGAEHIPHLFDRFFRADAARNRRTGGFGLGLPICRSIVEAHGGKIQVSSTLGEGTSVTMKLPVDTPH